MTVSTAHALPRLIRRILISWLNAVNIIYILLPTGSKKLEGTRVIGAMESVWLPFIFLATLLLLYLAFRTPKYEKYERIILAGEIFIFSVVSTVFSFTLPYCIFCLVISAAAAVYAFRGWDSSPHLPSFDEESKTVKRLCLAGVIIVSGLFFLFVSLWTVSRVLSFSSAAYDFGIFSQMFHSMKTTGLPITTIERDSPLSHFAVHVSPIYYLLLPVYYLFPSPITLQILQAAVLTSAVIPFLKLCTAHGINSKYKLIFSVIILAAPVYSGGTSFDLHENAFLPPLILWLFYGIDKKSIPITAIFALLTLAVKEDAAVYVAIIALYLIVSSLLKADRYNLILGSALFLFSIIYFLCVTEYLRAFGDGVMTERYKNFMYDGSDSLVSVIKSVLICPMKMIFECCDREKLQYILLTLIPLGGLIASTRKYERFILLIPYILLNLMSDYQYQHNIFFQYSYGSFACLIYLALINLSEIKIKVQAFLSLALAMLMYLGGFASHNFPRAMIYQRAYTSNQQLYSSYRDALSSIPAASSVATTAFYAVPLSERESIYYVKFASSKDIYSCDYLVIDPTESASFQNFKSGDLTGYPAFVKSARENGYRLLLSIGDKFEIYTKEIEN